MESAAPLAAAIEEPDSERHEESGEPAAAVGDDTPAPSVAPAKESDAHAPETIVRPPAAAMAASAASAATSPPQAAETIMRSTADTEVRPAPAFEAVPSEVGTSRAELTVAEDRVLTSPRAESRRRKSTPLLVGVLLAIVAVGGGLYLLLGGGTSDPPARPSSTARPAITGVPRTGETLRATRGTWAGEPTTYRYAWRRCDADGGKCAAIPGASSRTLKLTARDVDTRLRVAVTASNDAGPRTTLSRPTRGVLAATVQPSNVALPTVSGFAGEGSTLRAEPGTWKGTKPLARSYAWLRCDASGSTCVAIRGEHGVRYELTARDVGHRIRFEERIRNAAGAASAKSSATAAVAAKQVVTQTTPTQTEPTTPTDTQPEPTRCPPVCPNG